MDYTSTPINAIFPAGATNVTVTIPITMDSIVEETEMFDITFNITSPLNDQVIPGNVNRATVIITDDSGKMSC